MKKSEIIQRHLDNNLVYSSWTKLITNDEVFSSLSETNQSIIQRKMASRLNLWEILQIILDLANRIEYLDSREIYREQRKYRSWLIFRKRVYKKDVLILLMKAVQIFLQARGK